MAFLKNGGKRVSESNEGRRKRSQQRRHLPGLGGDSVGDLTAVDSVVHQQEFDVLLVSQLRVERTRQKAVSKFDRRLHHLPLLVQSVSYVCEVFLLLLRHPAYCFY